MRQEDTEKQKKLAVLIDADNTQYSIIESLLEEVANYGIANVKRVYGDWTSNHLKGWKEVLLDYGIQPIQQFSYTTGKNATDSAMIIDAMDLLYNNELNGFCIVSSDSDFTRLAARIRESGLTVFGFGEKKTPKAFIAACDKFIYTEILRRSDTIDLERPKSAKELKLNKKLVALLKNAVEDCADELGWAPLARTGQNILNKSPEFDTRNYGYNKLGELIKATQLFEIQELSAPENPNIRHIYLKNKNTKKAK
ncbi:MAG: NYN domain-containing protein [Spirochaetota bacterium]